VRLAEKLNLSARLLGRKLPVLLEINMGEEAAKSGLAAESPALEELLEKAAALDHLEFRGLMAIPPFTEDPEQARFFFRQLRTLRDQIAARALPSVGMPVLSMGMSHDFEIAVEEGSTCVRIGTAIFGERTTITI
jgi:pyridoxal phosphate enzyme (YggS family)